MKKTSDEDKSEEEQGDAHSHEEEKESEVQTDTSLDTSSPVQTKKTPSSVSVEQTTSQEAVTSFDPSQVLLSQTSGPSLEGSVALAPSRSRDEEERRRVSYETSSENNPYVSDTKKYDPTTRESTTRHDSREASGGYEASTQDTYHNTVNNYSYSSSKSQDNDPIKRNAFDASLESKIKKRDYTNNL